MSIFKPNFFNFKLPRYASKIIKMETKKYAQYQNKRYLCQELVHGSIFRDSIKYTMFNKIITDRKEEARKSILVQVQSAKSYKELHAYCSSFGEIKQMLHYSVGVEPMHFIIMEFGNKADVDNILSKSSHIDEHTIVPVASQFLWFKASNKKVKLKHNKQVNLQMENGNVTMKDCDLYAHLKTYPDINEQMKILYDLTKLDEVGNRLRYLMAQQIESTLSGLFPKVIALPFGSSVNGYGKIGCDLDLVLRLNEHEQEIADCRLMFHCKAASGSERNSSQRHMEVIGDLIQLFLPGCTQVRRILQARVPIIKFQQQFTNIECDLSMNNLTGVYMSDFLYLMRSIDKRVQPLIFTIRKWAQAVGVTNSSPGRWISNFSLTLLVLAFLQKPLTTPSVLPTMNMLIKNAGSKDVYVTEDGVNCTFLRDINRLNFKSKNTDSLKTLLGQFFEYYSQFDFSTKAVSLNEGVPIIKPEQSALYIVNPLERGLNVSKNVSLEELEKFKLEVRNAAWLLESSENLSTNGILTLFNKNKNGIPIVSSMQRQGKLLQISKLFEEATGKSNTTDFKNDFVKNQVETIKSETEQALKNIETKLLNKKRQKTRR